MDSDAARAGREGGEGAHAAFLAKGAPPMPPMPPDAEAAAGSSLVRWLRTPRPAAEPGVWRPAHVAKPREDPNWLDNRELLGGAALAALTGWLIWSLFWNYGHVWPLNLWLWPLDRIRFDPVRLDSWSGHAVVNAVTNVYYVASATFLAVVFGRIGHWPEVWRRYAPEQAQRVWRAIHARFWWVRPSRRQLVVLLVAAVVWTACFVGTWDFWLEPLYLCVPDSWWENGDTTQYTLTYNIYYALYTALLLAVFGSLGRWRSGWEDVRAARRRRRLREDAGLSAVPPGGTAPVAPTFEVDELLDAGHPQAAERLVRDLRDGRLSDLDYARIDHAWRDVRARPTELPEFAREITIHGAAAYPHLSGARDLPVRTAQHDLLTRQVRIGHALDDERNPYLYRGEPVALDPAVLGTSLLAVGPPGSGKTGRIIRPVTEALCLHALTSQAAVIAVGTARNALGPDDAFDVIIRVGDPRSTYQLDLYSGATDTDEAAALLAEALVGGSRVDPRDAAAVLVQLIGPFHAAYGQLPGVPELRAMLDGAEAMMTTLYENLGHARAWDQRRELDARARQAQRPDDLGPQLADLLALLDRAGFSGSGGSRRPDAFSFGALDRPLRVRIDLPATGHTEAGRIITRLLLAQFTSAVAARPDRSLFACLVLDDATAAITHGTVRGLTQLRPANAGAVLALRTLDDVPKGLRAGLLGAVGCRMAFSGITTWDAEHFARAWGTEWQEDTDVTRTPDRTGGTVRRVVRGVRKLFTGQDTTTESVTVRRVERERWSPSELAHRVPPRHAVLSLTTVSGEPGPPVLIRLG